jgi:hypothetical protein
MRTRILLAMVEGVNNKAAPEGGPGAGPEAEPADSPENGGKVGA